MAEEQKKGGSKQNGFKIVVDSCSLSTTVNGEGNKMNHHHHETGLLQGKLPRVPALSKQSK